MGVKTIHIILIIFSILLSIGFGFWTLKRQDMVSASLSFATAIGLIIYGITFIKKTKAY